MFTGIMGFTYLPPPVNKQQGKYEQHLHAAGFYGIVACSHLLLGSVHSGFTTWNARNQREINGNPRKSAIIPEIVACSHLLLEGAHSGGIRGFLDFIEKLLVTLLLVHGGGVAIEVLNSRILHRWISTPR